MTAAGPDARARVRVAARVARDAQARAAAALAARDEAVRAALHAGVPARDLADAAGLHRQRIYQIRDETP